MPENLEILHGRFGREAIENILKGESFTVDGVEFVSGYVPESTSSRFYIVKPPHLVERYKAICGRARGGNIVELGIAEGGSTALLALWAAPAKLVAVDLESRRLEALDEFIEQRGLGERVSAHYGVDQADGRRLQEIVIGEFGDAELDLVIDDASHHFGPTRASFEALFPYVREGGVYLIEDWDADVAMAEAVARALGDPESPYHEATKAAMAEGLAAAAAGEAGPARKNIPLTRLALELVIACASLGDAVAEIEINRSFVAVTKGSRSLDRETFALGDIYADRFGLLGPLPSDSEG
jgi:predicted O-methyltransferase YrrM